MAAGGGIGSGIAQPSTNASSLPAPASSLPSTAVEGVNNFPTNGQQNDFLPKQSRFASRTDSHLNRDNPHLISRDDYHGPEAGEYADRTNRTFDPRRGRGGSVVHAHGHGRNERSPEGQEAIARLTGT